MEREGPNGTGAGRPVSRKIPAFVRLIDLALAGTALVLFAADAEVIPRDADATVFAFHVIFLLLTVGAFFWEPRAFAWRAVFWVSVATAGVFVAVLSGQTQIQELLEIPLLSGILVAVFMISYRRAQAQARLREKDAAFLEAVLENMEDAVVACDAEGNLAFSNAAARLFHGLPEADLPLGRWSEYYEMYAVDEDERLEAPIFRVLTGEKVENELVEVVPDEGRARFLLVSGNRMTGGSGDPIGAVVVMRDVTERRMAQQRLLEAQEDERERIARDLHDEALQDLSAALRLLESSWRSDGEDGLDTGWVVKAIQRAVQGLRNSIYDLRPKDAQDRSLPELVESVARVNRESAPGLEIRVEVGEGFPAELPQATRTEVSRIVQEALVNVRRHSAATRARVSLRAEDGDAVVEVSDDGRGFESDAALDGLGLRGMKERAAKLGGVLEAESRPGEGATVRLRVPRSRLVETGAPSPR
jgi:PAS domain S-box-containing protein